MPAKAEPKLSKSEIVLKLTIILDDVVEAGRVEGDLLVAKLVTLPQRKEGCESSRVAGEIKRSLDSICRSLRPSRILGETLGEGSPGGRSISPTVLLESLDTGGRSLPVSKGQLPDSGQ